jgi:sugar/nucleoside kinase (ribokinase family)
VIGAIGKIVVDVVITCDRLPEPDEHQNVVRLVTAGGAAANVTAQLAARGQRTILAGWQGTDALSGEVADQLRRQGVTLRTVSRGQAPVATVLAWDGDRAFLVDQGDLRARLDDVTESWFEGMSMVHLNGFELLDYCWPEVLAEVAARAHRRGILVSVDCPSATRITAQGSNSFRRALDSLEPDIVFANRNEAQVLKLLEGPLAATDAVVVHAGTAPSQCRTPEAHWELPVAEIVDHAETTGCGDAFAAGFLTAWQQSQSPAVAVETAHTWAAAQARVVGAQPATSSPAAPEPN